MHQLNFQNHGLGILGKLVHKDSQLIILKCVKHWSLLRTILGKFKKWECPGPMWDLINQISKSCQLPVGSNSNIPRNRLSASFISFVKIILMPFAELRAWNLL